MPTEEQLVISAQLGLGAGERIRMGARLTIPGRTVTKLSFLLAKTGSPTGDVTFTIRKVSDDSILASKVWGDASALLRPPNWEWKEVTFDAPIFINEEVRILVEFSGGDHLLNYVNYYCSWTDVKAGECLTYYIAASGYDAGAWSPLDKDGAYIYTYTAVAPTGTTDPATIVGDIEATLNGTVTGDGGEACEVRFQYGLTAAYGTNTAWQPGKLTDDTFSQSIHGLTPDTEYHFRAQIKNSAGTADGADRTFTTKVFPTPFLRRVLRDVFGGGLDISAANPLQVYDPSIAPVEDSASGTTTNAWADALDLDYRGVKVGSFEIKNTDPANSLDYKVLERVADYTSGDDEELQASFTLAFGEKAKVNLEYAHSRIKIQVIDTVALSHATYTIRYLLNR